MCLVWLLGLLTGSMFLLYCKPFHFSLMRSVLNQPVSIVGLFCSVSLPLIFTFISVLTGKPIIIWIVCFLKSAAFSFSGVFVSQYFGSASWLVRFLFLFGDCCVLSALFILWFRRCGNEQTYGRVDLLICGIFSALIAAVDYFVISPFVMGLL